MLSAVQWDRNLRYAAMNKETMIVLTTCGNDEDAGALSRVLVERRLAACVNAVSNVASTYRWKGEVQRDRETLLIIKTTAERLAAVEKTIREQSRYELPEVIALPVQTGSADYLSWIRESVAESKD
jgi:periplasmic divalent cation tolerance protein